MKNRRGLKTVCEEICYRRYGDEFKFMLFPAALQSLAEHMFLVKEEGYEADCVRLGLSIMRKRGHGDKLTDDDPLPPVIPDDLVGTLYGGAFGHGMGDVKRLVD